MNKTIFCIRHGLALHNVLYWKIGKKAYKYRDTPLLPDGYKQAKKCRNTWNKINDIELILVSPLSRTLETMRTIFKYNKNINVIALDELMEYPHGNDLCNKRKRISELELVYPNIDFSNIKYDEDETYDNIKETIIQLKKRQEVVKKFIRRREEDNIVIVSHSSWIGQFLFDKIEDEVNELKHCFPFPSKL